MINTEDNYIVKEFEMYYPHFAREVEGYYDGMDPFEMIVKLKDGRFISYDIRDKFVRFLASDDTCDEEVCKKEFGIRLRRRMMHMGFTQNTLSEVTGIPQPNISDYINGKTTPSFYTIVKLARVLECSIDDFRWQPTRY